MYNREMGNLLETVRTVRSVELGVWSLELRVELWDVYFLRNIRIVVLSNGIDSGITYIPKTNNRLYENCGYD